uniref:Uncharacterized protein n=1 Tax=viral metagenome TaxID=1070528 RepID=A0A6C0HZR9_9ZZZZ
MATKKTYKVGDVVARVSKPTILGTVIEVQIGKDKTDLSYFIKFYDVNNPGEYETETCTADELISRDSDFYDRKMANLNVGPSGGSRKSRRRSRRSRKNRRTRRVRR